MVDMHCHVIYGVDDGAQTPEEMQAMLRLAHENRVTHIICTSHITPGEAPFPHEEYNAHLAEGQAYCDAENLGITLYPGSEILYTDHTARLLSEGYIPRLNHQWAVLAEFWWEVPYDTMLRAAETLTDEGMTVVFAHIERYKALRSIGRIEELKDRCGVLMQMNCRTIYEKQGFLTDRWKRKVLDAGLIDLTASDAHNTTSRCCNLLKAYNALKAGWGEAVADRLCGGAQMELFHLGKD